MMSRYALNALTNDRLNGFVILYIVVYPSLPGYQQVCFLIWKKKKEKHKQISLACITPSRSLDANALAGMQ